MLTIVGPTCSGKTTLSLLLADRVNSEIISADSRQIYKHLDIGTAKPSSEELKKYKHHFIDELDPAEDYNISKFEIDGLEKIDKIFALNKIPIVVGGSGLYVRALVDGIFNSVETDEDFRAGLVAKKEKYGNEFLYEELKKADPVSAGKMLPQNWKRIIRALEVLHLSGKPIWQHHDEHKRQTDINFVQYGINWDRDILYQNIEARVDEMINDGLVQEVEQVLSMGYTKHMNSLNTVGYKEIISFLENEITLERAIELIKRNTRRFAKRQMTWFRKDERIKWLEIKSKNDLILAAEKIITENFGNVRG